MSIQPGTPLPWRLHKRRDETEPTLVLHEGETDDVLVADLHLNHVRPSSEQVSPDAANAAYIVRACNSFPDLLEALERILTDEEVALSRPDFEFARAAIRKATGANQ